MKKQVLFFVLILFSSSLIAQTNDPVIMKVNGKDIKKSEFEYIYQKNNNERVFDKKNLEEYITLFKNFKLKVAEAETQGLDTTIAFSNELNEYRTQLAKSYLTNSPLDENLIRQEYGRLKEKVEISHILITFSGEDIGQQQNKKLLPADTLASYKKIMQIQKRLSKGENFEKVAMEVSNDKRSLESDRKGYLGWFTALSLIPSMEDGAYNTPVGHVSEPVRTAFGYHIIKVLNRQINPGQIRASHILISCPSNADTIQVSDAEIKIKDIQSQVQNGEDFAELAKRYSEDKASAVKGGDLSWFGSGQMVPEFEAAAFALKEIGDVTQVRTQFGFHIIKLLERRPFPTFEEKRDEVVSILQRNGCLMILNQPGVEKLKQENGFAKDEKTYNELYQAANTIHLTDSVFIDQFKTNESVLFIANDNPYTVAQFITFLKSRSNSLLVVSTDLLSNYLSEFEFDCLQKEENKSLEAKYPEFRNLMNEYRDGILLFEVSNREVWDKASRDTAGLKVFFEQHKANYAWNQPHYKGYVILCKDSKNKKKMMKETAKMNPGAAVDYLLENYKVGEVAYVKIEKGLFVKGDNPFVDETIFKTGKAQCPEEFQDFFVLGKLLPDLPEEYTDVKGLVITDYQQYLEDEWVKMLNEKYPVQIYPDVVNAIK